MLLLHEVPKKVSTLFIDDSLVWKSVILWMLLRMIFMGSGIILFVQISSQYIKHKSYLVTFPYSTWQKRDVRMHTAQMLKGTGTILSG